MATAKPRKRSTGASRKTPARKTGPSPWRWYGAGVVSGLLLAGLLYVGVLAPDPRKPVPTPGEPVAEEEVPKPRFDFYTGLPEQTIDVEVDPAEIDQARNQPDRDHFLLQAGSFRQADDADRRRAELLLLGLDPKVEETNGSNGRWFRVYLGPFDSRSRLAKARSLTAAQGIDTLLLKRKPESGNG